MKNNTNINIENSNREFNLTDIELYDVPKNIWYQSKYPKFINNNKFYIILNRIYFKKEKYLNGFSTIFKDNKKNYKTKVIQLFKFKNQHLPMWAKRINIAIKNLTNIPPYYKIDSEGNYIWKIKLNTTRNTSILFNVLTCMNYNFKLDDINMYSKKRNALNEQKYLDNKETETETSSISDQCYETISNQAMFVLETKHNELIKNQEKRIKEQQEQIFKQMEELNNYKKQQMLYYHNHNFNQNIYNQSHNNFNYNYNNLFIQRQYNQPILLQQQYQLQKKLNNQYVNMKQNYLYSKVISNDYKNVIRNEKEWESHFLGSIYPF